MLDMRMLEYLESLTNREFVMNLMEDHGHLKLRFDEYPGEPDYLLELWERAAAEIEKRV